MFNGVTHVLSFFFLQFNVKAKLVGAMSSSIKHDFSNLFKYRHDLCDGGAIVLFRVSSRSCLEFLLHRWNDVMLHISSSRHGRTVQYIQLMGSNDVIQSLNCFRYKGRLTPEKIFQTIEKKLGRGFTYDIEQSALHMPKKWCSQRGILVDSKVFGYTVVITKSRK